MSQLGDKAAVKLCKDCEWSHAQKYPDQTIQLLCMKEESKVQDLVFGKDHLSSCAMARLFGKPCGPLGNLWEKRVHGVGVSHAE